MQSFGYFIALVITVLAELIVLYFIRKRGNKRNQLVIAFELTMLCMMLWCIGLIIQILVINFIGQGFNFHIGLNIFTSALVGLLGLPGAVLLIILQLFIL